MSALTLNAEKLSAWLGWWGAGPQNWPRRSMVLRTLRGGRIMLNGKEIINYPLENVYCAVWFIAGRSPVIRTESRCFAGLERLRPYS